MANGHFLGGMAQGIESGRSSAARMRGLDLQERGLEQQFTLGQRGLDLQERGLNLKKKALEGEQARATMEQVTKNISDTVGLAGQVIQQAKAENKTPEQIAKAIQPFVDSAKSLARRAGADEAAIDLRINAMMAAPTATEAARAEGTAEGTKELAKAEVLGPQPAEFTEAQAKAAGYADRMAASHNIITGIEDINEGVLGFTGGVIAENAPAGAANALFGVTSEDRQKFIQAQRDFINAVLRRESGAVISEAEFANARKQYFPQPGDTAGVLVQKRLNRLNAIKGIARAAGPDFQAPELKTEGPPPTAPLNPAERKVDTVYMTPKGPGKWTAGGWELLDALAQ